MELSSRSESLDRRIERDRVLVVYVVCVCV